MNWQEISETALTVIFSTAGISLVLKRIFEKSFDNLSNRLTQNHQLTIDKILEDKKASNERKNYVSKVRFDKEFEIYAELSNAFFGLVVAVNDSIPTKGPMFKANIEQNLNDNYSKYAKSLNITKSTLNRNAVFIPKNIYEKYYEIIDISMIQFRSFTNHKNKYQKTKEVKKIVFNEDEKNITSAINSKFDELNTDIRNHLQNLEVKG